MNKLFFLLPVLFFIPLSVFAVGVHAESIEFKNIGEYIAFENRMKQKLDLPIIAVDSKTGELRPDAQLTTDYTKPIFHHDKTDTRILILIDNHAERENQKVLSKQQAVNDGWKFDEESP